MSLDELASVRQIKGSTSENFDMSQVASLAEEQHNYDNSNINPEDVQQIVDSFKGADLKGVDPQALLDTLATFQHGAEKFDQIGERLKNLKDRVDSSEISD